MLIGIVEVVGGLGGHEKKSLIPHYYVSGCFGNPEGGVQQNQVQKKQTNKQNVFVQRFHPTGLFFVMTRGNVVSFSFFVVFPRLAHGLQTGGISIFTYFT